MGQDLEDGTISEEAARKEVRRTAQETSGEVGKLQDVDQTYAQVHQSLAEIMADEKERLQHKVEELTDKRVRQHYERSRVASYREMLGQHGRQWVPQTLSGQAFATAKPSKVTSANDCWNYKKNFPA